MVNGKELEDKPKFSGYYKTILKEAEGSSIQLVISRFSKIFRDNLIEIIMHGVNIEEDYIAKIKSLNG